MFPRVVAVRHVGGFVLEIRFANGLTANLDFTARVSGRGGVFEPLQDLNYFGRVSVDHEAGTIVWPNGVDFCPDVLFAEATGKDIADMGNELEVA
ncbi:MAG: DUF2442 domain-containing protein [Pirellulaceae bacterium]|nr:DUF2442 domain-containing protein [Pirellulaceae bacterium]